VAAGGIAQRRGRYVCITDPGGAVVYYPLTVRDFLDRAAHVYPDRVAVVDEPEQPGPSLGEPTYRELAALARAQAASTFSP
jgi:hypothetical protein